MDGKTQSVEALHTQIEKTEATGEQQELLDEIKTLIHRARTEPGEEHHRSLKERLEEAVIQFDAEHHELVMAMQNAITVLDTSGV